MTPTSVTRLSLGYDLTVDDEGFITMRLKPRSTSTDGGHNTLASALGVNL